MIDSRCGLHCTDCGWKKSHGCGGCIETNGQPFYGKCSIADCCQNKAIQHCGECEIIPCDKLYAYSYLDPEHGDKPQGARVEVCRHWAAESGKQAWGNVLLTSAGWWRTFEHSDGVKENILNCFLDMLGKPVEQARVLFIPTAANDDESLYAAAKCRDELISAGIKPESIYTYDIDGSLTKREAMEYDAIYFTGGNTEHLLRRIKETNFDEIIKKMVYSGKVYVGTSAGSIIATPNIGDPFNKEQSGLCLVNAYLSVHCPAGAVARTDLPLSHIPLTDNQALAVSLKGYRIIEG